MRLPCIVLVFPVSRRGFLRDMPMKLHPNARIEIRKSLQIGMTLKRAADLVGYSVKDVREAMRADPVFDAEMRQAGASLESDLLTRITGAQQWQAWKFLLQSLYPGRYYAARKRKPKPPQKAAKARREKLAKVTNDELRSIEPILKKIEDDDGPESGVADERGRGGDGIERADAP
jgi:hypothetical protein